MARFQSRPLSRLPLLSLALAATVPVGAVVAAAPASASKPRFTAKQAFRKGIRETARIEAPGSKPSRIRISCVEIPKIDDRGRCTGSFDLVRKGRRAHYLLKPDAGTFRISHGAVMYEVSAKAEKKVRGLPLRTGITGILQ
ncbi:hypothetical protein [Patulibacter americanus]|uniref:hypothetical protein n=1 Tax=Patulibacter americanus TaxID=588672 RepID=UPI0003B5EB4E|nr:hypothetical protein [Patulibacter americanus]